MKKGSKMRWPNLRGDTVAVIRDAQTDELPGSRFQVQMVPSSLDSNVGCLQCQTAAFGHRIASIQAQIHEDLVHLARVGVYSP